MMKVPGHEVRDILLVFVDDRRPKIVHRGGRWIYCEGRERGRDVLPLVGCRRGKRRLKEKKEKVFLRWCRKISNREIGGRAFKFHQTLEVKGSWGKGLGSQGVLLNLRPYKCPWIIREKAPFITEEPRVIEHVHVASHRCMVLNRKYGQKG